MVRRPPRILLSVMLGIIVVLFSAAPVCAAAGRDSFDSRPDIYEPDDTAQVAHHLALNDNEVHSLFPPGDVDWFSIDASDGIHAVRIFGGGSHVTYTVYDSSGRELMTGTSAEDRYVYYATFEVGGNRTPHGRILFKITSAAAPPEGTGYGIEYLAQSPLPAESRGKVAGVTVSVFGLAWVALVVVALVRVLAVRDTGAWRGFLLFALWSQGLLTLLPGAVSLILGLVGLVRFATGQMNLNEGANGLYLAVFLGYGIVFTFFGGGNLAIAAFVTKRRAPLPDGPITALPEAAEQADQADGATV
jgi:hypothetical protein